MDVHLRGPSSCTTGLAAAAGDAGRAAADILSKAPTTASPVAQDCLKLLAGLLTVSKGCVPNGLPSTGIFRDSSLRSRTWGQSLPIKPDRPARGPYLLFHDPPSLSRNICMSLQV